MILKELIKLANMLDEVGESDFANEIEGIIIRDLIAARGLEENADHYDTVQNINETLKFLGGDKNE